MNDDKARQLLLKLVEKVLVEVSVESLLDQDLENIRRISSQISKIQHPSRPPTLIAIGKSAERMAAEFVARTDIKNWQGVVCTPYLDDAGRGRLPGLEYFQGGHPLPNEASLLAAKCAVNLASKTNEHDAIVYLVSGGASAAFVLPDPRIALSDIQDTYRLLVSSRANIREINSVRIALSQIKGGKLAARARPAYQFSLVISDVPGDDLGWVSSGPSIATKIDPELPIQLLKQYQLWDEVPSSIQNVLQDLNSDADSPVNTGEQIHMHCLGSNRNAVEAAQNYAVSLGWNTRIESEFDETTTEVATRGLLKRLEEFYKRVGSPASIVAGGEVLGQVRGKGKGGRNQAYVMHCLPLIAGQHIAVISFGTDGIDGNSKAAGAFANGESLGRCQKLGIDLNTIEADSNSNELFRQLGDLVSTGPTQNNLRDVRLLVKYDPAH